MSRKLDLAELRWGTDLVKRGFAKMQKGGVVMDVTNAEQAAIAEEAGAVAVMALERVPADIRAQGGVSRMSDPSVIEATRLSGMTVPISRSSSMSSSGSVVSTVGFVTSRNTRCCSLRRTM